MAKNQNVLEQFRTEAVKPLYAVAGVTDLAVEAARGYVSEAQQRYAHVQKRYDKGEFRPSALQSQAMSLVNARVDELATEAKDAQAAIEALPAKVESYVNETLTEVEKTYTELTERGEKLVLRMRRQQATQDAKASAKTTVAKVKTAKTQTTKSAKSSAKKTGTAVKETTKTAKTNTKSTTTAAKKTAASSTKATGDAAGKVGA
ncbi:MAG: hypothetical protein M3Z50_11030 [Actinomycetota bacterium]|nr:hypothetical protein [Actinomycetota bacterium]